jgi:hypothetical protein
VFPASPDVIDDTPSKTRFDVSPPNPVTGARRRITVIALT